MMSSCTICRTPTDLALSDIVHDQTLPLQGTCGNDACVQQALAEHALHTLANAHLAHHQRTGGRQSPLLGTGWVSGRNELGESVVVHTETQAVCYHPERTWALNGQVLICDACLADCT